MSGAPDGHHLGLAAAGLLRPAAVTLIAAGLYRLLQQLLTAPGLDLSVLAEFFGGGGGPPGLPGGPMQLVTPWMPHAASGTAAIGTYVSASVLVVLLSGVIPSLRRLREAGVSNQAGFQWVIAATTALLAAAHGLGAALYLEGIDGPISGLPAVPAPGWAFRAGTMLTLAAAALLILWLARQVTARGLGNGVVVLLAADILDRWYSAAPDQWRAWAAAIDPVHQGLRAGLFLLALLVLAILLLTARRLVPLERTSGPAAAEAGEAPSLSLRINPCGALPVVAAPVWLVAGFHPVEGPSLVSAIALCLLVALAAHLYAVEVYHPRDTVERLGRLGFRFAEAGSPEDAVRRLRATLHRAMVPGTLGLCVVALAPWIAGSGLDLPPGWSSMCGLDALVLAAAGLHLRQQVRSRRSLAGREVAPVLAAETRFELDLAADVLRRAGIDSRVRDDRAIAATGTLALWEVSRPRWPILTVYPHLGGGQALLLVDAAEAEAAEGLLREAGQAG
ncbi:MAG: hypothetical protein OXG13_05535 [Gemmatimonadaceae bacterium]|nr:hypothetical protein [Gemmatimonadaceae bacterium]